MPNLIVSKAVTCPYCWEAIEISVDLSVAEQEYVEDCFVCCRPILIRATATDDGGCEVDVAPESA